MARTKFAIVILFLGLLLLIVLFTPYNTHPDPRVNETGWGWVFALPEKARGISKTVLAFELGGWFLLLCIVGLVQQKGREPQDVDRLRREFERLQNDRLRRSR